MGVVGGAEAPGATAGAAGGSDQTGGTGGGCGRFTGTSGVSAGAWAENAAGVGETVGAGDGLEPGRRRVRPARRRRRLEPGRRHRRRLGPGRWRGRRLEPDRRRGRLRPDRRHRRRLGPGRRRLGPGRRRSRHLDSGLRRGRRFRPGRRRRRRPGRRREERFQQANHPRVLRRPGCLSHAGRFGRPGGRAIGRVRRARRAGRGRQRAGRGRRLLRPAPGGKGRLGLGNRREQRFGRAGRCQAGRRWRCLPRRGRRGRGRGWSLGRGRRGSLLRMAAAEGGERPPGGNPEATRVAELADHGRPAARAGLASAGHEPPGCVMLPGHAAAGRRTADSRPANVAEVITRRVVALWAHCPHTHPFEPIPLGSP